MEKNDLDSIKWEIKDQIFDDGFVAGWDAAIELIRFSVTDITKLGINNDSIKKLKLIERMLAQLAKDK